MGLVSFHYTLGVMLASIIASASCLSSYVVSRNRVMLCAFAGFLCYFFDIALVFQDEFVSLISPDSMNATYTTIRSLLSLITGGGFLASFWLMACEYVGERRRAIIAAPIAVYLAVGAVATLWVPSSGDERFWFWTVRQAFMVWVLGYLGVRAALTKDEVERGRLTRWALPYAATWVLVAAIVVEDVLFFLVLDVPSVQIDGVQITTDRNYAENLLVLCASAAAIRHAVRTLSLRFDHPPVPTGEHHERQIGDNLQVYATRHHLSARECEVLHLVLQGKDNQNIASELSLALSTVKVHVHNILQKTEQPNRQALIKDFWKTS